MNTNIDRRSFTRMAGMCLGGVLSFTMPTISFASAPQSGRLLFVLLRGGFDGLAAVPPVFDPAYAATRGALAVPSSELVNLSEGYTLTPGLSPLMDFWNRDELTILHAMAIPYRTRSHFDGQAILETGIDRPNGSADGWMNRLLAILDGKGSGIAVAAGMPRVLSGPVPVTSWSPARLGVTGDAFMEQLHLLYRNDSLLSGRFEAALGQREINDTMSGMSEKPVKRQQTEQLFRAAATLMTSENGPNIGAMEMSGWDTHTRQGGVNGRLDKLLGELSNGLVAFREAMADSWQGTTVVVMTEFGRTAKPNGANGTDHGTAGAGFLLGSGLAKSQIITDWPGLAPNQLFEGRDLAPTLDTRAVLKGAIAGTFDLTRNQSNRVFPGSDQVNGLWDLMG